MKKEFLLFFAFVAATFLNTEAQPFVIPPAGNDARQLSCQCYQLTSDTAFMAGAVWNQNPVNLNNPFDFTFRIFLGNDSITGADGMVFVIQDQNTSAAPSTGGGMGYSGFAGHSLGVEFDTNDNGPAFNDIPQQHIAIDTGGVFMPALTAPVSALTSGMTIDNNAWHLAEIKWTPATQTFNIFFDGVLRINYIFPGNLVTTVFNGQNSLYWGWTGGTGQFFNVQQMCVFFQPNFVVGANHDHCGPDTVSFTSIASSGLNNILSYAWDFGDGTNSNLQNPVHTYPAIGVYNVQLTMTDASLCTADTIIQVVIHPVPTSTSNQTNVSCFQGSNGVATIVPAGGNTPYSYIWNPNVSALDSATGLTAGNYAVTTTDLYGCTTSAAFIITEPLTSVSSTENHVNILCNGMSTGSVTVAATGGTPGYTYTWNPNVSANNTSTNLPVGTYSVTTTDANNCSTSIAATLTEPPVLSTSETHIDVLCNGGSTGSVTITVIGGMPGYGYTWSPNISTTATALNIPAGSYDVTVTDANNCTTVQTSVVNEPTALIASLSSSAPLCFGQSTGSVAVTGGGGVTGYNYFLLDTTALITSANGQFNNLASGSYSVIVIDMNGCADTIPVLLTQPTALVSVIDTIPATCHDYSDGQIIVIAAGAVPPYNYNFSTGQNDTSGTLTGLPPGNYSVLITDSNGCMLLDSMTITQPDSVLLILTPDTVQLNAGQTIQIPATSNLGSGITYQWSNDGGLSCYDCLNPVFSGNYSQIYTVTATNQNGCMGTSLYTVLVQPTYGIFVPNAFSPNGDGSNDFWQIFGNLASIKQLDVAVFDRIGEKVFESTDINFKWDGTYQGKPASGGVYTYLGKFVWLDNHSDAGYKGALTLIR